MEENKTIETKILVPIEIKNIHYEWDELDNEEPTLENIIGQEDAKTAIDYILKCIKIRAAGMSCKIPDGIMLYGYPGTGKSMLMQALKNEINSKYSKYAMFRELNVSEITAYVGTTSEKVFGYFEELMKEATGRIIILAMDEADDIIPRKEKLGAIEGERVSSLLTGIDGLDKKINCNLIGILTTNHPNKIEPAFLRSGRIGTHILTNLPSDEERLKGVKKYIGILPYITDLTINSVYKNTPRWTHSDYKSLYNLLVNEIKYNRIDNPKYILNAFDITKHVSWVTKHRKTNFEIFEQEYKQYSVDHDDIFEQMKSGAIPEGCVVSSVNVKSENIEIPKKKRVIRRKILRNKQEINSQ